MLNHRPDAVTIDYGLNDVGMSLEDSEKTWKRMIEQALDRDIKVILLTPSWEKAYFFNAEKWSRLILNAEQIRTLAAEYSIGLCDSFQTFQTYVDDGGSLIDLLSHVNHPNENGHTMIALELSRWFLAR